MRFRDYVAGFHARLGATAIPLGMGCATIGQGGDAAAQKRFAATLDAAYESGLRYYDTSAQYGGSEFRVGRWLKGVSRPTVFLATKSPIPAALTPEEANFYVKQSLRNSLERLGVMQIDLFQIHDVEKLDQVIAPGGALEALVEAKHEGLIRYFGLATRFHDLLETAVEHGNFDTILTYLDYTLLDQSADWLIDKAAAAGLGVIMGSPLSFGLLTGEDPLKTPYLSGEFRQNRGYADKLYRFCRERGISLLSLALQYPLRNPGLSITLTGPASPEELTASVAACLQPIEAQVWHDLHRDLGIPLPRNL